jgi:hypothetical protein
LIRTHPTPGVITADEWGRWAICHACGSKCAVSQAGEIQPHSVPRTRDQMCRIRWAAADLASAIARDDKLTDAEQATRDAVRRWLDRCRGTLSTGEPCGHRNCAPSAPNRSPRRNSGRP